MDRHQAATEKIETSGSKSSLLAKPAALAGALLVVWAFPEAGWRLADWGLVRFGYPRFGFGWDLVHHLVQMGLALGVMALPFWGRTWADWGFNNQKRALNKALLIRFTLGFLVFFPLGKLLYLWVAGWPPALSWDPAVTGLGRLLLFRSVMPGLSEEILFRALVIGILARGWKGCVRLGGLELSAAAVLSAILFMLAHVGFTFAPFGIAYFNPGQMLSAFLFGLFYAWAYEKTGSLLVPMAAHNVIDGAGTLIDWILTGLTAGL